MAIVETASTGVFIRGANGLIALNEILLRGTEAGASATLEVLFLDRRLFTGDVLRYLNFLTSYSLPLLDKSCPLNSSFVSLTNPVDPTPAGTLSYNLSVNSFMCGLTWS